MILTHKSQKVIDFLLEQGYTLKGVLTSSKEFLEKDNNEDICIVLYSLTEDFYLISKDIALSSNPYISWRARRKILNDDEKFIEYFKKHFSEA